MSIRSAIDFESPHTKVRVVDTPGINAASFRAFVGFGHWVIGTIPGYVPGEDSGYVDSVQVVNGDENLAAHVQDFAHDKLERDLVR